MELYALKRKHVDLVERMILFEEQWSSLERKVMPLKDREWRHVPINDDLYELFTELGITQMDPETYIFPRIGKWRYGGQAEPLRAFCDKIGIPSICFHTLRACWATQLLKNKVPEVQVMAMGGWSDSDTMYRYIRLAGIDVKGATDSLSQKRERPARVLKLVRAGSSSQAESAEGVRPEVDDREVLLRRLEEREALLAKLLSADPKLAEKAAQEWATEKARASEAMERNQ
jgi:hypothetical protein